MSRRRSRVSEDKPERMLSFREAGEHFSRSGQTVARWVHDGLLNAVRLPNGVLAIPESEVLKFKGASAFADQKPLVNSVESVPKPGD